MKQFHAYQLASLHGTEIWEGNRLLVNERARLIDFATSLKLAIANSNIFRAVPVHFMMLKFA